MPAIRSLGKDNRHGSGRPIVARYFYLIRTCRLLEVWSRHDTLAGGVASRALRDLGGGSLPGLVVRQGLSFVSVTHRLVGKSSESCAASPFHARSFHDARMAARGPDYFEGHAVHPKHDTALDHRVQERSGAPLRPDALEESHGRRRAGLATPAGRRHNDADRIAADDAPVSRAPTGRTSRRTHAASAETAVRRCTLDHRGNAPCSSPTSAARSRAQSSSTSLMSCRGRRRG